MANQCPKCNHKIEFIDSDGVEWETWACGNCNSTYEVTIEITRHWDTAIKLNENDKEDCNGTRPIRTHTN